MSNNVLDLQRQADDAEHQLKLVDAAILTLARKQRSERSQANTEGTTDQPDLLDLVSQRTGFQSELSILTKLQRDLIANGTAENSAPWKP